MHKLLANASHLYTAQKPKRKLNFKLSIKIIIIIMKTTTATVIIIIIIINLMMKINEIKNNSLKHLGQHLSSGGNSGFLHNGFMQLFGLHLISPLSHIHVLQPSSHLSLSSFLLPSTKHDFLQSHFSRLLIRSSCATSYKCRLCTQIRTCD